MIRLIASDLDGTLLQNGAQRLTEEALDLIRQTGALGIQFVAASGRQYANMKRLFGPVWEDVIFIAENGALIVQKEEILDKTVIPRDMAWELIRDLHANDACDVVVSGVHSVYLQPKPRTMPYIEFMLYNVHNTMTVVNNLCALNEDIIKISAIVYENQAFEASAEMRRKWSDRFQVAVSGKEWVDFTLTSKGEALNKLCARLSLKRDELVAFGDNFNDESMFQAVGYSYAMSGARSEVQDMARHRCDSVENVLKNILSYYKEALHS